MSYWLLLLGAGGVLSSLFFRNIKLAGIEDVILYYLKDKSDYATQDEIFKKILQAEGIDDEDSILGVLNDLKKRGTITGIENSSDGQLYFRITKR